MFKILLSTYNRVLMPFRHRKFALGFANLPYSPSWLRKLGAASLGIRKDDMLRTLALYLSL